MLSGSHGRSFRIRHQKLPEAPPCGEIRMTPYLVGNKTLLSRKPCIRDEKLLRNVIRKYGRFIGIRQENLPEVLPSGEITIRHICLAIKPRYLGNYASQNTKLLMNAIRKYWSLFQNQSRKFAWSAPLRRNHDDVISDLQYNLVVSETMHPI